MTKDILRYDKMVEAAYRGIVREALARVAQHGLPGSHHFYITFRTAHRGVTLPDFLRARYPDEMTIVLEHQFWDLTVNDDTFGVTLSFQSRPERLTIPLAAITAFADPSVKFALQFHDSEPSATGDGEQRRRRPEGGVAPAEMTPAPRPAESKGEDAKQGEKKPGEVVTLDAFRKK